MRIIQIYFAPLIIIEITRETKVPGRLGDSIVLKKSVISFLKALVGVIKFLPDSGE